jgi:predicted nucleic acid-binding protein
VSGSFLLDTNVAIAFLNGESPVVERFKAADEILWIAASALQSDLILLTHDAHFSEVVGLQSPTSDLQLLTSPDCS